MVCRVWTRSLMRLVSRTVRLSTGDSVGAPVLFRVDADTSAFRLEDATPRTRACVPVRALLGRVARAGLLVAFPCASPFLWPFCPSSFFGPFRAGVGRASVACLVLFFFSVFVRFPFLPPPLSRPRYLRPFVLPGPGCPGPWRSSFAPTLPPPPRPRLLFPRFCSFPFLPTSPRAPALSTAFCVSRPWVPWALALFLCSQPPHFFYLPPPALSAPPLSRLFRCFRPWVPWALALRLCPPLPPPLSLSLSLFFVRVPSFPLFRALLVLLACGVCAVCWGCPPCPPAAARVSLCLVSCCVVPRFVVGCFVWFVAFCGVLWCLVVLVSCCVVCCRAVLLVFALAVSPGRCLPLSFLLVSCGALLCRAVLCGVLSCVVPSRVVMWCVVLCVDLVCGVVWSSGAPRCVGLSCPPPPPTLLLPPVAVAWSPVVAFCCVLPWGAVLCWSVVPPVVWCAAVCVVSCWCCPAA